MPTSKKTLKAFQKEIDDLARRIDMEEERRDVPQRYMDDWNKANAVEFGLDQLFKRFVKRGVIV